MEKNDESYGENYYIFSSSFCGWLRRIIGKILRFLGFKLSDDDGKSGRPINSSPGNPSSGESDPPAGQVSAPTSRAAISVRTARRRSDPPRPRPSHGGGGQIN